MLDRTKNELVGVGTSEFQWLALTKIERRLIGLYRLLSEQEQAQLCRLSEVLVAHLEEPVGG